MNGKTIGKTVPALLDVKRVAESGPGIAAQKPDTEQWGPSDVDRLCDDA